MKNNLYKQIIATVGAIVVLASCNKTLDLLPTNDVTSATVYADANGYKQAFAKVYASYALTGNAGPAGNGDIQGIDEGTSDFLRLWWKAQELSTDEAVVSWGDPGIQDFHNMNWSASNPMLTGLYYRCYYQITLANDFIRQSADATVASKGITGVDAEAIKKYRAEARFLRAYQYSILMDLFGKAPFNTENEAVGVAGPEYSRQQLFNFIETEMLAVAQTLKAPRTNEYGRVDKAFAWMVLAKMYLNAEVYIGQNKYDQCVTMCNNVIGGGYTLEANYLHNFTADNHTSTEMIFTLQSDGIVTQNYGPTTVILNGQVGSVENNGSTFGVGGWGGALRLRKQFVQKFAGSTFSTDERNTIISGSRPIEITNIALQGQGFVLGKFSNKTSTGVAGANQTFVDTDFPLFRLSDVYLMYAECAKRGATNATMTQAVTYVNNLRERANNSTSNNISQTDLTLDFILDERSRELHWEGHRRQDLIRFNKYVGGSYNWTWKGNSSSGVAISNHFKVFPIPSTSLASNPNLTQNTGY